MGNRQKGHVVQDWELDTISNLVGIPRSELNAIYMDFRRVSKDNLLDKYEFRRIYKDLIKNSPHPPKHGHLGFECTRRQNAAADRIFKTFDVDHSGRLTFDEFISAYILLQNSISPQVRLNFLLNRYAPNNGYITPTMGQSFIQHMSILYGVNMNCQQLWQSLTANNACPDGCIPQQAFADYFINHPAYAAAFYNGIQVPSPPPSPIC